MKGVSIKCPNCGANVSVVAEKDDATCTYCGTTCEVRRRSRVLQRQLPARNLIEGRPVATVGRSSSLIAAIVIMVAIVVPVGVGVKRCASASGLIGRPDWEWDGVDSALLADVNGDGVQDAIGRVRNLQSDDTMAIAAFDGRTGKRLWKSEKLGARGDLIHTASGFVPGLVMVGAGAGELVGIGSTDGSIRWRIRLSEKIERLCAGGADGFVVAETADKRRQKLAVADGAALGPAGDQPCAPLPNDSPRAEAADRRSFSWHGERSDEVPRELPGMRVDEALQHPPSGVTIALGCKQPGTTIPMIGRFEMGSTTATWTAMVPADDPLAAPPRSAEPDFTAVDGDGVAVAYNVKFAHFYRVTLFAAADGRRLWDAEVPAEMPMSAVRMSPTHVFVSTWNGLTAYDRATGKRAYTVE